MSHELRTALNTIIGSRELLEEDELAAGSESAVSDLKRVQNATHHLLELIQDILMTCPGSRRAARISISRGCPLAPWLPICP